jgi:hypothetical protein
MGSLSHTRTSVASSPNKKFLWVVGLCAALGFAGCGDASGVGKTVPVTGKVTLGGQALKVGIVVFTPDAGRGNTSKWVPSGMIGADGTYSLHTDTKEGAPPGWYKVSINTTVPPPGDLQPGTPPPMPVAINAMYNDPDRSGFAFEVTESPAPDAYDIPLKQ